MNSPDIDEDEVRLTAYFLWEQEGRPELDPSHFWQKALEIHRRAHANGLELEAGVASQGAADAIRSPSRASDPHPSEEGDPYGARDLGGTGPVAG